MYFPSLHGASRLTSSYAGGTHQPARWHLLIRSTTQRHLSRASSHLWAIPAHSKGEKIAPFIFVLHNGQIMCRSTLYFKHGDFSPRITIRRCNDRVAFDSAALMGFFLFLSVAARTSRKAQLTPFWDQQQKLWSWQWNVWERLTGSSSRQHKVGSARIVNKRWFHLIEWLTEGSRREAESDSRFLVLRWMEVVLRKTTTAKKKTRRFRTLPLQCASFWKEHYLETSSHHRWGSLTSLSVYIEVNTACYGFVLVSLRTTSVFPGRLITELSVVHRTSLREQ